MAPSDEYFSATRSNISLYNTEFSRSSIVCSVVIAVVCKFFVVNNRFPVVFGFHSFPWLVYGSPRRLSRLRRRKQYRIRRHVIFFAMVHSVQEVNQKTYKYQSKTSANYYKILKYYRAQAHESVFFTYL